MCLETWFLTDSLSTHLLLFSWRLTAVVHALSATQQRETRTHAQPMKTGSPLCTCITQMCTTERAHRHPYFTLLTPTALRGLGGAAGGARVPERSRDWLRALPLRQPTLSHFLCPPFLFQSERGGEWMFPESQRRCSSLLRATCP